MSDSLKTDAAPPPSRARAAKSWLKLGIRLGVLVLVAWGLWRSVSQANRDLQLRERELAAQRSALEEAAARLTPGGAKHQQLVRQIERLDAQRFRWNRVSLGWLAAAGGFYLVGLMPCWIYWHLVMCALGQHPRWRDSLRAHYIGHLGKYVPGKALVVVLRTGLVRGPGVETTLAAVSVFVETLTMMSTGALVAAVVLAWQSEQAWLIWLAVGLAAAAGLPTLPPVMRFLVRKLQPRNAASPAALLGLKFRHLLLGWTMIGAGWLAIGLSLWAVIQALPGSPAPLESLTTLPTLTACISLALVAGFLSLLPGGLGVRELVIVSVLSSIEQYGATLGLTAAIVVRLVWLVAETLLAAVLYYGLPGPPQDQGAAVERQPTRLSEETRP